VTGLFSGWGIMDGNLGNPTFCWSAGGVREGSSFRVPVAGGECCFAVDFEVSAVDGGETLSDFVEVVIRGFGGDLRCICARMNSISGSSLG